MDIQEHMIFDCWSNKFNEVSESFWAIEELCFFWGDIFERDMNKISEVASEEHYIFALYVIICICFLVNIFIFLLNVFHDLNGIQLMQETIIGEVDKL